MCYVDCMCIIASLHTQGGCFKTPSEDLKPWILLNTMYTLSPPHA